VFTLTKLSSVGDEDKTIPPCIDISSPMIAPPVLPQSAFSAFKKTDRLELDRFKFFVLDVLNARRGSAGLQLESQPELMGSSGIQRNIFNRLWERVGTLKTDGLQLKTDGFQRSNFRRLKFQLKLTWRPFAMGAIFKTPQSNRKCAQGCRAQIVSPTTLQTQKTQ
jgi:hypothetical protein